MALAADIEKAFLMVSVAEQDRNVLRFLWVDDIMKDDPRIIPLRFKRVVFGVSSSPFLLNATIPHDLKKIVSTMQRLWQEFLVPSTWTTSLMVMTVKIKLTSCTSYQSLY